MPVNIGSFEPLSEEEFNSLRPQKGAAANPAMVELLNAVESGKPMRVMVEEGQNAKGLRIAIARAATRQGLNVETLAGDGFIAVKRVDEPRGRKSATGAPVGGKRRGRPPKRQVEEEVLARADNERITPEPVIET